MGSDGGDPGSGEPSDAAPPSGRSAADGADALSDERARRERAEQILRDERARREHAEQALGRERERAELWRRRAEERAERIRALRRPRARLRAWLGRSTTPSSGAPQRPAAGGRDAAVVEPSAAGSGGGARRPDRALPSVRLIHVTAAGSRLRALAEEFDAVAPDGVSDGPVDADLFLIDAEALGRLPREARDALDRWLAEPARAPAVAFTRRGKDAAVAGADRVVDLDAQRCDDGTPFLPWFDRAATTVRLPDHPGDHATTSAEDGLTVIHGPDGPVAAWLTAAERAGGDATDTLLTHAAAVPLMAAGIPVLVPDAGHGRRAPALPGAWELAQASVAQRRAAHASASSARRARDLAALAGIAVPPPIAGVAAILISNRPDRVLTAVDHVLAQTIDGLELHVGLHGGGPPDLHADVSRKADAAGVPSTVRDLPAHRSLGWCYNAVIQHVATPVVAKIDDDDHYGPNHLTDGVQALDYAGADITGKATYLAYVVEDDATYLVNGGKEEREAAGQALMGGSLVLRRSAWERSPFPDRPSRVDSLLLRAARAQHLAVHATSRFEFVYERRAEGHTWGASADRFRARAVRVGDGLEPHRYRAG